MFVLPNLCIGSMTVLVENWFQSYLKSKIVHDRRSVQAPSTSDYKSLKGRKWGKRKTWEPFFLRVKIDGRVRQINKQAKKRN